MTKPAHKGHSRPSVSGKYNKSLLEQGHKVSPYRPDLTAIKKAIKDCAENKK